MSRYIFIHGSVSGEDFYIPDNVPTEIKGLMPDLAKKHFNNRDDRLGTKLNADQNKISKALLVYLYKGFICYTFLVDNLISIDNNNNNNRPGQCFCITILSKDECLCCENLYPFLCDLCTKGTKKILNNRTYLITTFKEVRETLNDIIKIINDNIDNKKIGMSVKDIPILSDTYKESTEVINFKDYRGAIWDEILKERQVYLTDTVPTIEDKCKKLEQEKIKLTTNNSNKSSTEIVVMKKQLKEKIAENKTLTATNIQLKEEKEELLGSLRNLSDEINTLRSSVDNIGKIIGHATEGIVRISPEPPKNKTKKKLGVKTLIILQTILMIILFLTWLVFFFRSQTNNVASKDSDKFYREESTQHPQEKTESNGIDLLHKRKDNLQEQILKVDIKLQEKKDAVRWLNDSISHNGRASIGNITK